jgi:hypothetical protein
MRVDAESLVLVLRGRALCTDCLADNLGADPQVVEEACTHLMIPQREPARCDGCLKQTIVHRLG